MFQYFELELPVPDEKLQKDVNMEPEGAGNEIRIFWILTLLIMTRKKK